MSLLYVYALLSAGTGRGTGTMSRVVRMDGRRIHLIQIGTIQAAVERIAAPPTLSEGTLRAQHELVVALGRRFDALLPVRFGATLEATELERLLTAKQTRLQQALDGVRGREQMTVRILSSRAEVTAPLAQSRTGRSYLRRRRKTLAAAVPPLGKRVRRAVTRLVAAERVDAGRGRIRASLHHLIPRGRAAEYRALVERSLAETARGEDQVVVSGPWPPFAFSPELWP